ncbi:MAG: hypothetical protein RLZZ163_182 [Actinomycetota bacterium]|jgi:hypothetical protein
MGWTWRYETTDGTTVMPAAGTDQEFGNQADAESWLGEAFRVLLDQGVDQVTLIHDGTPAYTLSLHPAE